MGLLLLHVRCLSLLEIRFKDGASGVRESSRPRQCSCCSHVSVSMRATRTGTIPLTRMRELSCVRFCARLCVRAEAALAGAVLCVGSFGEEAHAFLRSVCMHVR